jgi:hypothetical protein
VVPALVAWGVVCLVDIRGDYSGRLDAHVVQSCGDSATTDRVGVAGVPTYLNWMRYHTN